MTEKLSDRRSVLKGAAATMTFGLGATGSASARIDENDCVVVEYWTELYESSCLVDPANTYVPAGTEGRVLELCSYGAHLEIYDDSIPNGWVSTQALRECSA